MRSDEKSSFDEKETAREERPEEEGEIAELRSQIMQLTFALEAAKVAIWDWNLTTGAVIWSENYWGLTGLDPTQDRPSYENWKRPIHPDDVAMAEQRVQAARDQGGEVENEYRVIRPDGIRWLLSLWKFYKVPDSEPRMIGITLDITEMKEAEAALKRTEAQYRQIVETVRDYAIFMLDPEGNIQTWNRGATLILGYREDEIIGQTVDILYTEQERSAGLALQERIVAKQEGRAEDERWHVKKGGNLFWASGVLTALYDNAGTVTGFTKVMRDNTERKRIEEERVLHARQLAEKERVAAVLEERNRMAQEIHDTLAQAITGIFMQLEAAEDALLSEPSQVAHHIARARDLSRESLQEARRSVRALRPRLLEEQDLPEALRQMVETHPEGETKITYVQSGASRPLSEVVQLHLLRIAQEAIANALQHAQAKQLTLRLEFEDRGVNLTVEDDGIDFDVEEKENVDGMGLRGMKSRAILMRGELQILSHPGQGTRILVEVPENSA